MLKFRSMALYFEFYGLPGAGKTTLINPLIQNLVSKGYKVAGRPEIYDRLYYRQTKLLILAEMLLHISNLKLYYRIWKLHNKSDNPNKKYYKRLVFLIHQILMMAKSNKYDIIICDEGIIQYISSLFFQDEFKGYDIMQKISGNLQNNINICPVFCSITIEESLRRMNERPYGQDRRYSYSLDLPLLEKVMKCRFHNLDVISSFFPTPIVVDMRKNVDENVNFLISKIVKGKKC